MVESIDQSNFTLRNKGQPRHSIGGVGIKFKKISELYHHFGKGWDGLD